MVSIGIYAHMLVYIHISGVGSRDWGDERVCLSFSYSGLC